MSYHDLRKGRFSETSRIYFITTVTHGRNNLPLDLRSARAVMQTMRHLDSADYVHSLSRVVMPDDLHWLFQLNDKSSLSDVMKRMKAISARSVNQLLNRKWQVWQKSYHDHRLRRDEDIKVLSQYIIATTFITGLVPDIGKYPHWDAIWLTGTLL
jgi:putative transposase